MCGSKVIAACIFNELEAVGLFLASFVMKAYSLIVSAVATSVFQLEHTAYALQAMKHKLSMVSMGNTMSK